MKLYLNVITKLARK